MVLELVGSRIMAPFVGTSIAVWTSLIGIILASISAGYYWGGKWADREASPKNLSKVILVAGILVALSALVKTPVLTFITLLFTDIRLSASLGTIFLFGPASLALGMVSPYAAKLKISVLEKAGTTVGTLYALSTIGSITGTFLAGFWLMAYLGSTNIMYVLALVLVLVSFFVRGVSWSRKHILAAAFIIVALGSAHFVQARAEALGIIETDSAYQHIQIFNKINQADKRMVKVLKTDAFGAQSAQYLDSDELVFEYAKFYNLAGHIQPNLQKALIIGGGAYSYPKVFLKKFPKASIDVVEMDPVLTDLSKKYFNLIEDPRLSIFHQDGRTFINQMDKEYDVVFMDAFNSLVPPFQLTTQEVAQKLFDHLSPNGVVLMNLISAINGEDGRFLQAEYATYKSVFPQVEIFAVDNFKNPGSTDNVLLVAYKKEQKVDWNKVPEEYKKYTARLWTQPLAVMPILTDEFAPVEHYLTRLYSR